LTPHLPIGNHDQYKEPKEIVVITSHYLYFFLPLDLFLAEEGTGLEAVDITLEAREDGTVEVALLPATDLTLSSALFCLNR
jgi:hypothetical protein